MLLYDLDFSFSIKLKNLILHSPPPPKENFHGEICSICFRNHCLKFSYQITAGWYKAIKIPVLVNVSQNWPVNLNIYSHWVLWHHQKIVFLHFSGKWDKNSLDFANVYAVINLGDIHLIVFLCNFIKFRLGRGVLTHFSILDKPWGNSFSLLEHCISLKVNTTFWNKRITLHNLLLFYTLLKDPLCMIYKLHWFIVMIVKKKLMIIWTLNLIVIQTKTCLKTELQ